MSTRSIGLDERLYDYILGVSLREPDVLRRLRDETRKLPRPEMQIAPEQGQFMALLVRLMDASRIVEVGTFTGYSALAMALALPPHGRLVACDISEDWTAIARRYWTEAGVDTLIDLRLAPALDTLDRLIAGGDSDRFDMAFIDADKRNYLAYYERVLVLLRPGGVAMIDNVLWGGSVVDDPRDADAEAIQAFNTSLRDDDRVDVSLVPIGDGLTLARKRG
jgi:predicted O-methyltransferase YrrM